MYFLDSFKYSLNRWKEKKDIEHMFLFLWTSQENDKLLIAHGADGGSFVVYIYICEKS